MNNRRNPSKLRGYRNVFCSDYNYCLDHAIKELWNSWNCGNCNLRFHCSSEVEEHFIHSQVYSNSEYSVRDINWGEELWDNDSIHEDDISIW